MVVLIEKSVFFLFCKVIFVLGIFIFKGCFGKMYRLIGIFVFGLGIFDIYYLDFLKESS